MVHGGGWRHPLEGLEDGKGMSKQDTAMLTNRSSNKVWPVRAHPAALPAMRLCPAHHRCRKACALLHTWRPTTSQVLPIPTHIRHNSCPQRLSFPSPGALRHVVHSRGAQCHPHRAGGGRRRLRAARAGCRTGAEGDPRVVPRHHGRHTRGGGAVPYHVPGGGRGRGRGGCRVALSVQRVLIWSLHACSVTAPESPLPAPAQARPHALRHTFLNVLFPGPRSSPRSPRPF